MTDARRHLPTEPEQRARARRRRGTVVRRRRERDGACWTRLEPGRTRAWKRYRAAQFVGSTGFVCCFVPLVLWAGDGTLRWVYLRIGGRDARAEIVRTTTDRSGEDGPVYRVYGYVEACDCEIKVAVNSLAAHPVGATIPLRYDPGDPSNAEALEDRRMGGAVVGLMLLVSLIGVAAKGCKGLRLRRRSRAELRAGRTRQAVRFEAWERRYGDKTDRYLILLGDQQSRQDEALLCVPVARSAIARLERGTTLVLYGSADPGMPIALRQEGSVILPTDTTRPGSWEHPLRRVAKRACDTARGPMIRRRASVPG